MLQMNCLRCSTPLTVPDELAGLAASCPHCGLQMITPLPQSGLQVTAVPSGGLPMSPVDATAAGEELTLVDVLFPPQAPDEIGRLGPYRVLKVLGKGGMGTVFLGEDPHLKRAVALKVLNPSLAVNPLHRERFLREGQAVAALEHEHVVSVYQVGEQRGVPYLAMKLLQGETLQHRLQRVGRPPVRDVLRIGTGIALGLEAAHRRGLIHRDLKPSNLWIEEGTGRVILLDFGLARPARRDAQLTDSGMVVGTPAYMSPEQATGREVDARSDLFSLGCVLYHLCTGELPFPAKDAAAGPPTPRAVNAAVPPALSDLVMRLLAGDPANRPASARQVIEELGAIEETLSAGLGATPIPRSPPDTGTVPAAPPSRRAALGWVVGGLGGVAAAVLLLVLLNPFGSGSGPGAEKKTEPPVTPATRPRLLVPAYFYPDGEELKHWDKLIEAAGKVEIVAVLNPNNGPGDKADPNYTKMLDRLRKAGVVSIGYVRTTYGKRPIGEVKADIDRWRRLYPKIQGFFLDEQASAVEQYAYYLAAGQHAKEKNAETLVVSNPGTFCAREYVVSAAIDVVCVTERGQDFQLRLPDWLKKDGAGKLAVLVYEMGQKDRVAPLVKEIGEQRVGYLYVTDAGQPNPWGRLPAWWDAEVETVERMGARK